MARAAVAAGTGTIVATPHVNARYFNTSQLIEQRVSALNTRLESEGVAIEVLPGAEVAMTRIEEIEEQELAKLRLGDGPWLLAEPPFAPFAGGLESIVQRLRGDGYRVLLAHPERCPAFHRDPGLLESLVGAGALCSVTAGSLVGKFGEQVRRFALELMDGGLVHNVASDAHDPARRAPGMASEIAAAGFAPLTEWLTRAVPEAILTGQDVIPPRPVSKPAGPRPSRWRWSRGRRPDG